MNSLLKKIFPHFSQLLLLLAPLPFFYFLFFSYFQWNSLSSLEERLGLLEKKALRLGSFLEREEKTISTIASADPLYLEKYLEPLLFLDPEIKKLEANCHLEEHMQKRLHFLREGENRLRFSEEKVRRYDLIRESEQSQQHPIEMNEEDLKKFLCLIEGISLKGLSPPTGQPQLLFTRFELSKKNLSPQEAVFVVSTQLIKREKFNQ